MTLVQAADRIDINAALLRRVEIGRKSPAANLIPRILRVYQADDSAYLFFCMAPLGPLSFFKLLLLNSAGLHTQSAGPIATKKT